LLLNKLHHKYVLQTSHDLVCQTDLLLTSVVNVQRDTAASSIAVWAEKLMRLEQFRFRFAAARQKI